MKTALVSLNVSYIHKNLALRWLMVTKPVTFEAMIFEGICKTPLGMLDEITAYQPDVVALSVYIFNLEASLVLINALKERNPRLKIVAGGPEATYHPEPLWDCHIDGIFKGEAELVFWDQLEGKTVQGYQSKANEETQLLKVDLAKLETYPSPYFLPFDVATLSQRYLYVETSRGCPFGCTYCMASLDRKIRSFSEPYVDAFFEQLKTSPVKQVKFLDRTFNVDPKRALKLAHQCLTMPEQMTFHVELVADCLDEKLKDFFIEHGKQRFRMEIGVQSLNLKTLQEIGRTSDCDKLISVIDEFSAHHLKQHVDLIAGLPYEDLATFKSSYQGLIKHKPYELQVGILKLLHGTILRNVAEKYGYCASTTAPYQILSNLWINQKELLEIEMVALATEKIYNSQKLKEELDILLAHRSDVAFDLMHAIGVKIKALPHPYTNQGLYMAIFEGLSEQIGNQTAQTLINHAYYKNSPFYPPSLFHFTFNKVRLNRVRKTLKLDQKIKHLVMIARFDGKKGHELWAYGSKETAKTYYLLNEDDQLDQEENR